MGRDLYLLPFDGELSSGAAFSHTVLGCLRRDELFEALDIIEEQAGVPVPSEFYSFMGEGKDGEHGYGITTDTAFGEPLRCIPALLLRRLAGHTGVCDNWRNLAIWAYLAELPERTPVALYWN